MKNFVCTKCSNGVYFENVECLKCKSALGFDAERLVVHALKPVAGEKGLFRTIGKTSNTVRYCSNHGYGVCNWLTPAGSQDELCLACALNRTIPNLVEPGSLGAWSQLEMAKKRLIYSIRRFGLPLDATAAGKTSGKGRLAFDFVRNAMTGHIDGVITIDILEADSVERERQRQFFGEPYRSLLGHLRHESGHFYWMLLIEAGGKLDAFRALFGDDRSNYGDALARHHAAGPPADWQRHYVSAYASAHPWEDWAETWAHYLHMVDALDSAEAAGIEPRSIGMLQGAIWPFKPYDIYREESFDSLRKRWIPLTTALNSLSRSMGHDDFYPFIIPAPAYEKLAFVHRAIRELR